MKITLAKPIYHKGAVLLTGTDLDTSDTHGRELLRKGYATQPQTRPKGDPPPKPATKNSSPAKAPKGQGADKEAKGKAGS